MATVGTSTATNSFTNAFGYPNNVMMDINVKTGDLWMVFKDQTNRGVIYKSTDDGGTWSSQGNFTVSGQTLEDIGEMRIDPGGDHLHMVLLCNNGSLEVFNYKRVGIGSGTADLTSGVTQFSGPAGTNQSLEFTASLVPTKNPDGSWHIFLAATQHGLTSGIAVYAITVKNDAAYTTRVNNAIIGPTRAYKANGDDTSLTCTVDVEHNGDGITSATPNVWITWLKDTYLRTVRCTWKGYKAGWQTPTKTTDVATGRIAERDAVARWDGVRYVIASLNPNNQTQMQLIERNASNTATTATRTSPSIGLGNITGAKAMSYNHVTKDVRLYVVVGANTVYYVDYFRGSNTWGSWTTTGWTIPVASEWGVRRGTWGTAQYDAYIETGAGSPWTISSQLQTVNFAPTAPVWITGQPGTVTQNGAAFDVSSNLTLDWTFNDPNPTDTQSSYALSRKIGTGITEWWRTSDNTWQPAELFNSTATTSVVLTTTQWVGGGGAADPAHVYKVATKDSGTGTLLSPYSSGLSLVPSTRADPTVTSPTVNQILNASYVPVTWTVSEQSQYRVQVKPAIASDTFTRTASSSWGQAEYGGTWTTTSAGPASDFSVASNTGRVAHQANSVAHDCTLAGIIADDVNLYIAAISITAAALTQPLEWGVRMRYIDASNFVDVRIYFRTSPQVPQVYLRSIVNGVEVFTNADAPAGTTNTGPVSLRFVADGANLYARVWDAANPEPTDWTTTLTSTLIDTAGALQIHTTVSASNTTTKPVSYVVDGLIMQDASLATHDSGFRTDPLPLTPTTLQYTVPTALPDGYAGAVNLTTKNAEGLASQVRTVPFTIDFVEPVAPTISALTASPSTGGINVTATQTAAAGSQPATLQMDIYRRKTVAGTLVGVNANPFFETNANDWTNSGYSTVARSTAQFHSGVASLLMTPNGSTATPKVQTTALYAVTVGTRVEFRTWLRSATANKIVRIYIDWYDNTPTLLSSSTRDLTPTANAWIYAYLRATVPPTATQVRIAVGQLATPAAGDLLYVDEAEFLPANDDNGIRVKADAVSGQSYLDWRAVTGDDYEYRGYAEATNGTTVFGPWTD